MKQYYKNFLGMLIGSVMMMIPSMAEAQNKKFNLKIYNGYDTKLEAYAVGLSLNYTIVSGKSVSVGPFISFQGALNKEEVSSTDATVSASLSYSTFDFGANVDISLSRKFSIWLGLGASSVTAKVEVSGNNSNVEFLLSAEDDGWGVLANSGIAYNLSNTIHIFLNDYYNSLLETGFIGGGIGFKF